MCDPSSPKDPSSPTPSRCPSCVSKQTRNRQPRPKGLCVTRRRQNHHDAPVASQSRQGTSSKENGRLCVAGCHQIHHDRLEVRFSNCKCQSRDSVRAPETSESHKRSAKVETASVVLLHVLVCTRNFERLRSNLYRDNQTAVST